MKLWVGTSGYSYKAWLGNFYPERLAAKEMLRFYASRLPAVEINNTFYRLPKESVLQSWAEQVPAEFSFVLKAPQRITHQKRLKDAESEVEYLFRVATVLGSHTGAVLFQLPPYLRKNLPILQNFLAILPADRAVAFEFRHASWFDDEVFGCLREHNRALCMAEMDETESANLISTATWGYVRLRRSEYSHADLMSWKERILAQPWDHAYVFFKHEDEGIGPRLAGEFLTLPFRMVRWRAAIEASSPIPLALAENAQTRKHSAVRAAGEFELFRKFDWPLIHYRGNYSYGIDAIEGYRLRTDFRSGESATETRHARR